jgi:hypothetical protein
MGRSIGSGGACFLASQEKIGNLILISPFSSIQNVAEDWVGCVGRAVKNHFDNLEQIRNYKGHLLVIHGQMDDVILFRHGKMVVEEFNMTNSRKCDF